MPCIWYFYRRSSSVDWAEWWADVFKQITLEDDVRRVKGSEIYSFVLKHLPTTNSIVLEGGCGEGGWVKALCREGFKVLGLDFSFTLVHSIHSADPNLVVAQGDVIDLPIKDESLNAYLSLGVVEHFPSGPQQAILEAWRVLKPNGILLIAVPYYNLIRRIWMPIYKFVQHLKGNSIIRKIFRRPPRHAVFYQYGFGFQEFKSILEKFGFQIVGFTFYDFHYGLFRDSRWLSRILPGTFQEKLAKFLAKLYPALCAHMILFAAKRIDRKLK